MLRTAPAYDEPAWTVHTPCLSHLSACCRRCARSRSCRRWQGASWRFERARVAGRELRATTPARARDGPVKLACVCCVRRGWARVLCMRVDVWVSPRATVPVPACVLGSRLWHPPAATQAEADLRSSTPHRCTCHVPACVARIQCLSMCASAHSMNHDHVTCMSMSNMNPCTHIACVCTHSRIQNGRARHCHMCRLCVRPLGSSWCRPNYPDSTMVW